MKIQFKIFGILLSSFFLVTLLTITVNAMEFSFGDDHFKNVIAKDDFLGTYLNSKGTHSITFESDGEGIFKYGDGSEHLFRWGFLMKNGSPQILTAREEKLRTGTVYHVVADFTTKKRTISVYVDTHWPKLLIGKTLYEK